MSDQLCSAVEAAVESAIEKVVKDFQRDPNHSWNESEITCLLFHYLQSEKDIKQEYPAQLIRAEFPTLKVFKESGDRGYYDLAVLDSESYTSQKFLPAEDQVPWNVKIGAAIEIRVWSDKCSSEDMTERIKRDVKKLTEQPNNVQYAYYINLVQLPFEDPSLIFYGDLYEYLRNVKHKNLRILIAPADPTFAPHKQKGK